MSKILNIVETAYRANIEEQDDPVVWIAHALKGAGADISVLLRGNAVNYAIKGQDASGLSFGAKKQTQPPQLARDITSLIGKGVTVSVVQDDAAERGLEGTDFIDGLTMVSRSGLPKLVADHDQVWHW